MGVPTVDITGPGSISDGNVFKLRFTFNEDTNFVNADFTLQNCEQYAGGIVIVNRTVLDWWFLPTCGGGNPEIDVAIGTFQSDSTSDFNTVGDNLVITKNADNIDPTGTFAGSVNIITFQDYPASFTNTNPIPLTVQFTEPVSGFTVGDITATNASVSNLNGHEYSHFFAPGKVYKFDVTPTGSGDIDVSLASGIVTDCPGNFNVAMEAPNTIEDLSLPTVVITGEPPSYSDATPFDLTMTFNENVTGFVIGDISADNATKSNFVTVDGSIYTVDITPTNNGETITVIIPADVCVDIADNGNVESSPVTVPADVYINASGQFRGRMISFSTGENGKALNFLPNNSGKQVTFRR